MKNWSAKDHETPNGWKIMKMRIKRIGGQCSKCPSVLNITVDHIIPRHFLVMLGLEHYEKDMCNLQLLCESCNKKKTNILDYTNPRTLPLLKMFVNLWIEKNGKAFIEANTRKITVRCLCHADTRKKEVDLDDW